MCTTSNNKMNTDEIVNFLDECVEECVDESRPDYVSPYIQAQIHYSNINGTNYEFGTCFMMRIFYFYDYIIKVKLPMVKRGEFELIKNPETDTLLLDKDVQWSEFKVLTLYNSKGVKYNFDPFPADHILFCFQFLHFLAFDIEAQIILKSIVPDTEDDPSFTFLMGMLERRADLFTSANHIFINEYNAMVMHVEDMVDCFIMGEDTHDYT